MWLYFALGGVVLTSVEEVLDKIIVYENRRMDTLSATFWRNLAFWLWIIAFSMVGIFGSIELFLTWPIFLMAALFMGSGLFYTYLLKKVEITSQSAISYASPFLFLLIDVVLLKLHLNFAQVAGILFLVTGGFMFVVNPETHHLKKEFTIKVFGIFLYDFAINVVEYYGFKYYFERYALNEVSFFFNVWMVMMVLFAFIILARGNYDVIWRTAREKAFLRKIAVSKWFDAASSYSFFHAMTLASVSQVNAAEAFFPVTIVAVAYVMQRVFRFRVGERFARGHLAFKLGAVVLLAVGGYLAR